MSDQSHDIVPADDDRRTLSTLKAIQAGNLDPKAISHRDRRQLVEYLVGDGYSTVEMAEVLKVTERTIERDKRAIRQANALQPDPALADQMAGRLYAEAELTTQRIRKAVRGKSVKPAVKAQAERDCFAVWSELTQRLQSLGHLPTAAQKLEAAVVHMGEMLSFDDLKGELRRLRTIASTSGQDPKLLAQLDQVESDTERARLAVQTRELSGQIMNEEGQDDESEGPDASA